MKYWGLTNYLNSRFYKDGDGRNKTSSWLVQCPTAPARCQTFASLGDSLNMINSNLTSNQDTKYAEKCEGHGKKKTCHPNVAFDSKWAFVLSPSETVSKLVAETLIKKGTIDHVN
jgi:hypothetical protein